MSFRDFVLDARAPALHHVGLTVSDLDRSLAFYRDVLELELLEVLDVSGPEIGRSVGVAGAELRIAFLRLAGLQLELLEYTAPEQRVYERRNSDVGAAHVCFRVSDLDGAYRELSARGVGFVSEPFRIAEGRHAGRAIVYFRDPDEITLELLEDANVPGAGG
ncbi:MAG TPA: VOC family protein [Gaiellaceae bacterium]|jgi:catechol 2,3-dioxygenase-like lactoylglutathione lyase family enzyme|nr:VOC family protein [Gaiellaceae bacterium]